MSIAKRSLSCLLAILIVFSSCYIGLVNTYAADEAYKTFLQWDEKWANFEYGGGCTIGSYGCMLTSIAILMAYANPELRDVDKFNPKSVPNNIIQMAGAACAWVSNDPTWKLVTSGGHAPTPEDAVKMIHEFVDKDYYVLIGSYSPITNDGSDHYSPVVGFRDDGTPILWDVSAGKDTWDDFMKVAHLNSCGYIQIVAYESTINPSRKALYNGSVGNDAEKATEEDIQTACAQIVAERELVGLSDIVMAIKDDAILINFASIDDLSIDEQYRMMGLESYRQRLTPARVVNIALTVVGFFILTYAVMLLLALIFDKTNSFFDGQLVTVFTLGRVKLVTGEELQINEENRKEGYVSARYFNSGIIIMFILGILLVSGIIGKLLYKIGF